MATHHLKTENPYFSDIVSGIKTFDLQLDGKNEFAIGDEVAFEEYDVTTGLYSKRVFNSKITYILKTKDLGFWPMPKGQLNYVVIGFSPTGSDGKCKKDGKCGHGCRTPKALTTGQLVRVVGGK